MEWQVVKLLDGGMVVSSEWSTVRLTKLYQDDGVQLD